MKRRMILDDARPSKPAACSLDFIAAERLRATHARTDRLAAFVRKVDHVTSDMSTRGDKHTQQIITDLRKRLGLETP